MKKLFIVLIIYSASLIAAQVHQNNSIDQLFLHKGNSIDRLVGYCTKKPIIKEPIITTDELGTHYTVIIENCNLSKRALDKMDAITKRRKRDDQRIAYSITSTIRDKDLHITFTYNPARIEIHTSTATSIKSIPTWIITIYDKRYAAHNAVSLNKPGLRVVIDCGHGGKDLGAVGVNGAVEKDITLQVGQKVSKYLEKHGFKAFMQRNQKRDIYYPLDDRTTFANLTAYADLVISIHANSSPSNANAHGLETFCLDTGTPVSLSVARTQQERYKAQESLKLARAIHATLTTDDPINKAPHDRGIKQALSQILLGVEAPAVLLELGFVTNPEESAALQDPQYQDFLAKQIVTGIKRYLSKSASMERAAVCSGA